MSNKNLAVIIGILTIVVGGYIFLSNKNDTDTNKYVDLEAKRAEDKRLAQEEELIKIDARIAKVSSYEEKAELYEDRAKIFSDLNRNEEAVSSQREAIRHKPDNAALYTTYFDLLVKVGQYPEAEEAIKKAISLNQNSTRWKKYVSLYKDHMKLGNDKVEALYVQAIASDPQDEDMIIAYAVYLEEIGNKQKAIEQYQKASVVDPKEKVKYDAEIKRLQAE